MTGKLCLRLEQTAVVNEVICPQTSDILWAREFLADFDASGGVVRDGSDLPRLGRARKILRLAEAFGITVEGLTSRRRSRRRTARAPAPVRRNGSPRFVPRGAWMRAR